MRCVELRCVKLSEVEVSLSVEKVSGGLPRRSPPRPVVGEGETRGSLETTRIPNAPQELNHLTFSMFPNKSLNLLNVFKILT